MRNPLDPVQRQGGRRSAHREVLLLLDRRHKAIALAVQRTHAAWRPPLLPQCLAQRRDTGLQRRVPDKLVGPQVLEEFLLGDHPLAVTWRVVDTRNGRTVQQGISPVGTLRPGAAGTFLSMFVAPNILGTYRLSYELSEGTVAVSETTTETVEIAGPRTYGGDEGRPIPTGAVLPTPSPSPRFEFPRVTIPKPSLPIELPFPRGKPTPSPHP